MVNGAGMLGFGRKLLLLICPFVFCSPAWADVTAEQRGIVEQWLKTADKVRTVQGEFDQVRYLKGVNKPLIRAGRLWMTKPGLFRWQIGEPPSIIAIRGKDEKLTVLDAREKKARIWTRETLLKQEAAGKGQGIAMLGAGFAGTITEFEKQFEIVAVGAVPTQPGDYAFTLRLRDQTAKVFVKSIILTVGTQDGSLRSFVVMMRDGSRMETLVRKYTLNQAISPDLFRADLTGYEIEEMKDP